jgi:hypothetical protein
MRAIKDYIGTVLLGIVLILFFTVIFKGTMTGNIVREEISDLKQYRGLMDERAFERMSTSSSSQETSFIITLDNYNESLSEIYNILPASSIKPLPSINAVAVTVKNQDMIDLMEQDIPAQVYLDMPLEIQREESLELLNISSIRESGPSNYNVTGKNIKIAVIDTGIDYTHSEFNCTPGDVGCFIINATSIDTTPTDLVGHGTSVLGIIHATAPDAQVYSHKITKGTSFSMNTSDIISAISMAVNESVDIISMSLGANGTCSNPPLEQAIDDAYSAGILVVAAAGNNKNQNVYMPACFASAVAIASINKSGWPSENSSRGSKVEFAMPGTDVVTTSLNNGYGQGNGTSFAAPFASATFAMLKEAYYNKTETYPTASVLRSLAQTYALDINETGRDNQTGYGMLQFSRLMDGLYNRVDVISDVAEVQIDDMEATESSFTLYSTSTSTINIMFRRTNFTIGSNSIPIYIEGIDANNLANGRYHISSNSTISFAVHRSDINKSLTPGVYYTNITYYNTTYGILSNISVILNLTLDTIYYDTELASFSLLDNLYVKQEINGSNISSLSLSNPTWNYLRFFNGSYGTFADDTDFNINDSIYPVLKVNHLYNNTAYNITLDVKFPSNLVETLNSTLYFNDGNYSYYIFPKKYSLIINTSGTTDNSTYLKLAEDGIYELYANISNKTFNHTVFKQVIALSQLSLSEYILTQPSLSNSFSSLITVGSINDSLLEGETKTYDLSGEDYEVTIVIIAAGVDGKLKTKLMINGEVTPTLEKGNVTTLSDGIILGIDDVITIGTDEYVNFTLIRKQQVNHLFFDRTNIIDFNVTDQRGHILNLYPSNTGLKLTYNSTLDGRIPVMTAVLSGTSTPISYTKDNITLAIPSSTFGEGPYFLQVNYSLSGSYGDASQPVTLSYPVVVNYSSTNNSISLSNNVTLKFNVSKLGSISAYLNVSFSTDSSCSQILRANATNFTILALNSSVGTVKKDILLYMNNNFSLGKTCVINITADVYNVCQQCSGSNPYSYTLKYYYPLNIVGKAFNITTLLSTNDTSIKKGEKFDVFVNITNNENSTFDGTIYLDNSSVYTDSSQTLISSVSLLAYGSTIKQFILYANSTGTNNATFVINNSATRINSTAEFAVSGDLISYSLATSKPVYVSDPFNLTLIITNNNNEAVKVDTYINLSLNASVFNKIPAQPIAAYNINPGSSQSVNYSFNMSKSGNYTVIGSLLAEEFYVPWTFSLFAKSGKITNITLKDTSKKYKIGINDSFTFIVGEDCDTILDDCDSECKLNNSDCKDSCKAEYNIHKDEYSDCRADCSEEEDKDDRDSCKADCKEELEEWKREYEDCTDECTDDFNDCSEICNETYVECKDEDVSVLAFVNEYEEDRLYFNYEAEDNDEFKMNLGDSMKFDFNDDGYYETQIDLDDLTEDENSTCLWSCKLMQTNNETLINNNYTLCKNNCSNTDSECKDDCKEEKDDAKSDVDDEYTSCQEDCDVVYTTYEIYIMSIPLEDILPVNQTRRNQTIPTTKCDSLHLSKCVQSNCTLAGGYWYNNTCNSAQQNGTNYSVSTKCDSSHLSLCVQSNCTSAGGYWYSGSCHSTPEIDCSAIHLDLCRSEADCTKANGYWYDSSCHAQALVCDSLHLDLCTDEENCTLARGYWYDSRCNSIPKQVCDISHLSACTTSEECSSIQGAYWYDDSCHSEPMPQCGTSHVDLCTDELSCKLSEGFWYDEACHAEKKSDEQNPSSLINIIVISLVVLIVLGFTVGGVFYFMHLKAQTIAENPATNKKKELEEYFMKQLIKGNNIYNIAVALKKLGWDHKDVDGVMHDFITDKNKQAVVKIVRFTVEYGLNDPATIRKRFGSYGELVLQQALHEIEKREIKK